jgi:hypothetical protein
MRTAIFLICLLLAGALILTAGCTEEAIAADTPATSVPTATATEAVSTLSVSKYLTAHVVSMQQYHATPPYWVVTVRVDNIGPVDVFQVVTAIRLIDEETGAEGPWKTVTFECITAGDYKQHTFKFYTDKGHQYRAEVQVTSSQEDRQ